MLEKVKKAYRDFSERLDRALFRCAEKALIRRENFNHLPVSLQKKEKANGKV